MKAKAKSHKVGRPTKKTEDAETIILRALENGATRRAAAAIAGMNAGTFRDWVATNGLFAIAVEQAQARFMESAAKKIAGHAPSLLKYAMMLHRDDEQLQPVQEKVAVDMAGDIQVRWSADPVEDRTNGGNASPVALGPDNSQG